MTASVTKLPEKLTNLLIQVFPSIVNCNDSSTDKLLFLTIFYVNLKELLCSKKARKSQPVVYVCETRRERNHGKRKSVIHIIIFYNRPGDNVIYI